LYISAPWEDEMFIEKVKNSGVDYLRLVNSVRVRNKNGYMVSNKKVILNIGPLSRFDDGTPDYLARLKESFKAGVPLIESLLPYCDKGQTLQKYSFCFTEGSPDCVGSPKYFSHILLEKILEELGLNTFFSSYKGFSKIQYDLYGFAKLMLFGRVLNPSSKYATVRQNDDYYEPIIAKHNPDNIYDTLSFIAENKDKIIRRMNTNLVKKAKRNPEVIFYDVTNFYFETEDPDDDILDDEGEIIEKGLRKMGVSKEQRQQPIVQMGLFMDDNGIPIAIEAFPGNTLDHLTLRPALSKSIDNLELSRFILVADRGVFQYQNILNLMNRGYGYIISKSLLKSPKSEREWAYSEDGYVKLSDDFKYKSRIIKRTFKDERGMEKSFDEKVVVYWSGHFARRQEKENKSFFEFLEKLEKSPENFRISAIQAKSIRKFLKKDFVHLPTGETIDSRRLRAFIDFDKVKQYRREMGYYQIVTSELTMNPRDVIDKYQGLTQIEQQFRVMKGTLETRPLYLTKPEHITAHLLICMIALILIRVIQLKILKSVKTDVQPNACFHIGLSADRIKTALSKWKVDKLPSDYFRFDDTHDPDLRLILDAFDIVIPAKLFRRAELKAFKTHLSVF
jgi:transposase